MIFFEVELSGTGVYNGPITGVKLPLCDSLTEFQQILDAFFNEAADNRGILASETFIQHGVACTCWYTDGTPYTTMGGASLNSPTAGGALLEAQNILPGNKYAPQILNPASTNVKFSNGSTYTLENLGYKGHQTGCYFVLVYLNKNTGEGKHCGLSNSSLVYSSSQDFHINRTTGDTRFGLTYGRPDTPTYPDFDNNMKNRWLDILQHNTPGEVDTDPYNPGGGNTEPGGGDGNPSDTNIPIDFPSLPTIGGGEGVADSGLISIFNPTLTQIKNLAAFMWDSSLFDLSVWQKLYADPMDAIITLSIVPIDVPSVVSKVLKVGNISTGLSMNVASKQFIEFDCGSISIEEFWGAYLDYEPYTKFEIFLPYIGYKEISANDIMTKSISLKYHIDILSGSCVAFLKCGDSIIYSWNGHCSMQIPLSGTDMSQMITGILGIIGGAATTIGGAMGGNFAVATKGAEQMASNAVNNLKPAIEKTGSIGAATGILGIQTPYLIITRPRQALPLKQNQYTGYPSFMTVSLSSITGFTMVEEIRLQNVPATDDELNEIERLLREGVIL